MTEGSGSVLTASIFRRSHGGASKLARMVEEAGADVVELNLSCPA